MKTIVITGAGKGIGKATAILAASKGYTVICLSRNIDKLKNIKNLYPKYLFYRFEENQFCIFWNNGAEDFCFTKSSGLDLYFSRA